MDNYKKKITWEIGYPSQFVFSKFLLKSVHLKWVHIMQANSLLLYTVQKNGQYKTVCVLMKTTFVAVKKCTSQTYNKDDVLKKHISWKTPAFFLPSSRKSSSSSSVLSSLRRLSSCMSSMTERRSACSLARMYSSCRPRFCVSKCTHTTHTPCTHTHIHTHTHTPCTHTHIHTHTHTHTHTHIHTHTHTVHTHTHTHTHTV